jgi:hypothetical protein
MNVEIGAEAAQFPEKEYINGIAVAVWVLIRYKKFPIVSNTHPVNLLRGPGIDGIDSWAP